MWLFDAFLLIFIVVVFGTIGEAILGARKAGFIISTLLGLVGAVIGLKCAEMFELPEMFTIQIGPEEFSLFWSIMGSGLFLIVVSIIIRRA